MASDRPKYAQPGWISDGLPPVPDVTPRTESGRALVSEPEWSDHEARRLQAIAIEREAASKAVAEAVDVERIIGAVESLGCQGNHKVGYCTGAIVQRDDVVQAIRAALIASERKP